MCARGGPKLDNDGGGSTAGSGLERAQAASGLKALITGQVRCTVEAASRAREQLTGRKYLMAGTQDTGGLKAEEGLEGIWMEMKMNPPPPPPHPFFY